MSSGLQRHSSGSGSFPRSFASCSISMLNSCGIVYVIAPPTGLRAARARRPATALFRARFLYGNAADRYGDVRAFRVRVTDVSVRAYLVRDLRGRLYVRERVQDEDYLPSGHRTRLVRRNF